MGMRAIHAVKIFGITTIDSSGTTSDSPVLDTSQRQLIGIKYGMDGASSGGLFVVGSISALVSYSNGGTAYIAQDSGDGTLSDLYVSLASDGGYIQVVAPEAPYTTVRFTSGTDTRIAINNAYAILKDYPS